MLINLELSLRKLKKFEIEYNVEQRSLKNTGPWGLLSQWVPWILPFLGPPAAIILLLFFGPCIFNLLVKFVSSRIEAVKLLIVLQKEPQMQSMTKIYHRPLDRPASPCTDVNDIESTPQGNFNCTTPTMPQFSRKQLERSSANLPNSTWVFLLRGGIERQD
ncbi:syncytin-1-like [Pan paniscus]|uniref:syncytin-1-like n=1 Tax=Pan paniscus TaxID=9597 RepID=UPI003003CB2C